MLTGELPVSICNLTNLVLLKLQNNRLTGKVPSSFGNLKNLTELDLSRNAFSGELSTWIGDLTRLNSLEISYNCFQSVIPSGLINLKSLIGHLNVSYNKLTGKIPLHRFPYPASSFVGNPGLRDYPLPPCHATA